MSEAHALAMTKYGSEEALAALKKARAETAEKSWKAKCEAAALEKPPKKRPDMPPSVKQERSPSSNYLGLNAAYWKLNENKKHY